MKRMMVGAMVLVLGALVGCSSSPAPESKSKAQSQHQQVQTAVQQIKETDPTVQRFFDTAYAYVVFPSITAGGLGVGGAYGKGEVYRNGQLIGYADMSQGSVGLQAGGQSYSEILFFKDAGSFDQFTNGQLAFDARASAVAASNGAAAAADYQRGVAVFTLAQGGLMAQAAIGGQKFTYQPTSGMATEHP